MVLEGKGLWMPKSGFLQKGKAAVLVPPTQARTGVPKAGKETAQVGMINDQSSSKNRMKFFKIVNSFQ